LLGDDWLTWMKAAGAFNGLPATKATRYHAVDIRPATQGKKGFALQMPPAFVASYF